MSSTQGRWRRAICAKGHACLIADCGFAGEVPRHLQARAGELRRVIEHDTEEAIAFTITV